MCVWEGTQRGQPQTAPIHLVVLTLALCTFQEEAPLTKALQLNSITDYLFKGFLFQPPALSTLAVFGWSSPVSFG